MQIEDHGEFAESSGLEWEIHSLNWAASGG